MLMLKIGMLTSGGDCQALNAAMRGVVKTLANSDEKVEIYGFLDGYRGLIYGKFCTLTSSFSGLNIATSDVSSMISKRDVIEYEYL